MPTEVIHTKQLEDGSHRVILDEPHGNVQAHRKVTVRVSGMKYDHDGYRVITKAGKSVDMPYSAGEEVEYLEYHLAGQHMFVVPKESTSIEFDDGVIHSLSPAAGASAETAAVEQSA